MLLSATTIHFFNEQEPPWVTLREAAVLRLGRWSTNGRADCEGISVEAD